MLNFVDRCYLHVVTVPNKWTFVGTVTTCKACVMADRTNVLWVLFCVSHKFGRSEAYVLYESMTTHLTPTLAFEKYRKVTNCIDQVQ